MYTWEIKNYLRARNHILNREEFIFVVNQVDNPQVTDVKCIGDKKFSMTVSDDSEPIIIGVR